jgi:hypothetical protein
VLCGRTTAYALAMLQANAARKRRSRHARAVYARSLGRRAFAGWREARAQLLVLEGDLLKVLARVRGCGGS